MKTITYACVAAFLCIFALSTVIAEAKKSNERTFTITLTESQLNDLWAVMGTSNSSYTVVTSMQTLISSQVAQQVKNMDSIKNKNKKP